MKIGSIYPESTQSRMQHHNPQKRVLNRREAEGWTGVSKQLQARHLAMEMEVAQLHHGGNSKEHAPLRLMSNKGIGEKGLPNNKDAYEGCLRVLSMHLTESLGYPKEG